MYYSAAHVMLLMMPLATADRVVTDRVAAVPRAAHVALSSRCSHVDLGIVTRVVAARVLLLAFCCL